MRKIIILLLTVLLITLSAAFILLNSLGNAGLLARQPAAGKSAKPIKPEKPERVGEKITYDVLLGKLTLGSAKFKHLSMTQIKGRRARLVTFETKVTGFSDLEKIYSDAETSLPLLIERSVSTWPFPEKITEDYDQAKFILTITKVRRGREEKAVISKGSVINNAILLPYFVRDMEDFRVGYSLTANLPTQEFVIELVAEEEVAVPAGKFKAYRFTSKPKKFEIWISSDKRRIPLKIKGSSGIGYTLVMREYSL